MVSYGHHPKCPLKTFALQSITPNVQPAAFYNCNSLTSVSIPNSVTTIGDAAFMSCSSFSQINVGSGNSTYSSVNGVLFDKSKTTLLIYPCGRTEKEYIIPNTVINIGENAFYNSSLTSITIPNSVTTIGEGAFRYCQSLTSVTIPNSVTTIGARAFNECSTLTSVVIPNSVTIIGDAAFSSCNSLSQINVDSGNSTYSSVDGVLFDKSKTTLLAYPSGHSNKDYNIPNTVTTIGRSAFGGCSSLTSIAIPNTVTTIGDGAFSGCSSLTSIVIPNTVTTIGEAAFSGCSSLSSIAIPDSTTTIGRNALPSNLKYLFIESEKIINYDFTSSLSQTDCKVYAYTSQHRAIQAYFNGSISPIGVVSYDVETTLTECLFKLYVPTGFEVKNITINSWGGSEEPIIPQITNDTRIITGLTPDTSYTVKVSYAPKNSDSYTLLTFNFSTGSVNINTDIVVSVNSTLTSISFRITKGIDEASEYGISFEGQDYALPVGDIKVIDGLTPNTTYYYSKYALINGKRYAYSYMCKTQSVYEVVKTTSSVTQTSVTIRLDSNSSEASECGIIFNGNSYPLQKGESKKFTGLIPFSRFYYHKYVKINEEIYSVYDDILTSSLNPTVTATATSPISMSLTGSWTSGDAVVTGCQAIVDGEATNVAVGNPITVEVPANYRSSNTHKVQFKVAGDGWEFTSPEVTVQTPTVNWSNGQAVATSTHSARLKYEVNLPTGTPGTGIEWRRIDAPDLVPSTKAPCEVVNETLVGTLKNLKDDVYYKFRPYYTALDGKSYYGDWVGLFTGDADVFFEPEVLTYAPTSSEQSVTLSGYALEGSDEIISQGFEYRPSTPVVRATSGWSVIKADGILMKATLTDLIPNATYICRSFVTTSAGTYYGEEQQFTAPALTGIETIENDTNEELNVALRENPVNGDAYIRISGSYNKAICSVYSLSGTLVIQKEVAADGLWQSVEMDRCIKGMYVMHVVCGNERKSLRVIKR